MNKKLKLISLALVLTLAMSLFSGLTVFAADVNAVADPTQTTANGGSTPDPNATATPTPEPTATPVPVATVTSYEVYMQEGNDQLWGWNERADVRINVEGDVAVSARLMNNTAFTANGNVTGEVRDNGLAIVFKNVRYNGGGNNLQFELTTANGVYSQSLTIAQCYDVDPNPATTPTPTPAPTAEPDVPKILVKDFTFGGTNVEAGKEFTLDITLFTTSGNTSLKDVMVGLNFGEAKNVSLASGSMNTYVGEMAPSTTKHITYKIITAATIEPGAIGINVQVTSKNGEASSSPISIPVVQPERFEITNMEAPEMIMMGEEGYLSVTFVNKGKSAINNLSASIQGDNLANPGQSQFLGNVAAGTENSADFNIMASAEGTITGKVILSYEDAKGETQTLEKEFSCTVQAMPSMDPGMMDPGMMDPTMGEDVKSGMPWWGWLLIVVGVGGVAAVVVVIVLKKKKAKKLAQLEDEDEDI